MFHVDPSLFQPCTNRMGSGSTEPDVVVVVAGAAVVVVLFGLAADAEPPDPKSSINATPPTANVSQHSCLHWSAFPSVAEPQCPPSHR